jgi:hypothetical protein
MAENERNTIDDTYKRDYVTRADKVGTSASTRQTADQIRRAEETRLLEAARIQRQTAGASFAEQYQQAKGNIERNQMAGAAPGLTGGLAEQRTSEISGAQMRGLSQLSGQRAQAMRDIDYQALMAPRQAFEFSQQQVAAQRDDQMFNLQMIQARQGIIDSEMSDSDKLQALLNTGMSKTEAQAQLEQKNKGFFEKLRTGEANPFAVGALGVGGTAAVGAAGFGAAQIGGAALTAGAQSALAGSAAASAPGWFKGGSSFVSAFKTALAPTKTGKFLISALSTGGKAAGAAGVKATGAKAVYATIGKALTLGLGLKILPILLIGGAIAYGYSQWAKNK